MGLQSLGGACCRRASQLPLAHGGSLIWGQQLGALEPLSGGREMMTSDQFSLTSRVEPSRGLAGGFGKRYAPFLIKVFARDPGSFA